MMAIPPRMASEERLWTLPMLVMEDMKARGAAPEGIGDRGRG